MENMARRLGEEKVSKLLWQFSVPSIISTLASSIYIIIDRIFIGRVVGADAIAGMSVTMPISFVILAFGMLVGVGSGALVSIRLGEGNRDEAEVILGNALTLILIISVVTTFLFLVYLNQILIVFGASPAILSYAREFIRIILLGSFFQHILFGLPIIIRAEGHPRTAMNILLINVGVNIILDFVFICLLGWAVKGAAAATVISQAISAILVLWHFRSPNSLLHLRLKNMRLRPALVKGIVAVGMAPFVMQLASSVVNTLFNQDLARYGGDAAIGAFGIINAIIMFLVLPVLGINMGAQPIIGFNYGARRYDRVIEALQGSIVAATVITTAGFILMELFPRQMFRIFTDDASLIAIGTHGIRIIVMMLPVVGFQIVSGNFFQAIGKARIALILALLRQVMVLIPALIFLPRFFHLNGVWFAAPVADGLAVLITLMVLLPEIRKDSGKDSGTFRLSCPFTFVILKKGDKMPIYPRKRSSSGIYHIMLKGIDGRDIFLDDEDRIKFIENTFKAREKGNFELYAYCLMDNHVHLLVKESEAIGTSIKRITVGYVQWHNNKYARTGHLFQNRYLSEPVETDSYLLTVVKYIHQNPLKAGIVTQPADYKWSSYLQYLTAYKGGNSYIDTPLIMEYFKLQTVFETYMNEPNHSECLEYKQSAKYSDEILKKIIRESFSINDLMDVPKDKRNKTIRDIHQNTGVSIRQLARVLGVGKNIIERALK